ncbi:MAG TPA: PAS domain-containing sensor histidine kinase [Gemmatimonadaceae bacterium]|nr:PAS domain-containing sensor histidine kinase [Gemmatimonadaceae bacterium]
MLDTAPCGFVSFTDDGLLVGVNATLAQLLDYPREELEQAHLQKILPPGGRIFYNTHVLPLLKLHGRVEEVYLALRTREGEDLPMLMNAARRDGVNDAVFVRMTQRHRYEDELLEARRVAEAANAAKEKFLSMMSHDLRTPLTAISGYTRLLTAGVQGPLSEEQLDTLERVQTASGAVARMIEDILDFAQIDSGRVNVRVRPVALRDAVTRAESLVRLRFEEAGLTLATDCDGTAIADPDRLQQVLLNLLTNASKFTPRGGRVSVETRRDGDRIAIAVRDTGSGIAPEHLQRIFEPFVQLDNQPEDRKQHGVGLGLAISRDLVRAMGGELRATSVVGEGSAFTISLPVG